MESYSIPTSSLGKISRWFNQKKASGQIVQPWELESAYNAELNALESKRLASRGMNLSEASLAETKRMNDINTNLRKDEIDAGKTASTMGAVGNLTTTIPMLN